MMKQIAVIGSGSWGVALAIHLANIGHNVKIWSYSEEEARLINEEKRCMFLKNVTLPNNIECKTNYKDVIEGANLILHVTPSKFTRDNVQKYKEFVNPKTQPIIICSKGFEKDSLLTLDEVIQEEIPNAKTGLFVVIPDFEFRYALDKTVQTVFIPQEIVFEPYSYDEINSILKDRAKIGFYPNVISDEIILPPASKV